MKSYNINYYEKRKLINNLQNNVFCRLQRSKIQGIGVFAIKDIPKNKNPFEVTNKCQDEKIIDVHENELDILHPNVKRMIQDFYHKDDNVYGIPLNGLNNNDISYYMNHSDNPNIKFYNGKRCNMVLFKSIRNIKDGEELTINYDSFN